jgi:hypothetical protein
LKNLRRWRQSKVNGKVKFVFAGSVGIHYVVNAIENRNSDLNDLATINCNPLDENTDNKYFLIEQLLVHHQKTLVNKLFENAEFGNKLQEQYKPLYYACQILNGKANENNLMLRIPPELNSTVKAILDEIEEQQEFYK